MIFSHFFFFRFNFGSEPFVHPPDEWPPQGTEGSAKVESGFFSTFNEHGRLTKEQRTIMPRSAAILIRLQ